MHLFMYTVWLPPDQPSTHGCVLLFGCSRVCTVDGQTHIRQVSSASTVVVTKVAANLPRCLHALADLCTAHTAEVAVVVKHNLPLLASLLTRHPDVPEACPAVLAVLSAALTNGSGGGDGAAAVRGAVAVVRAVTAHPVWRSSGGGPTLRTGLEVMGGVMAGAGCQCGVQEPFRTVCSVASLALTTIGDDYKKVQKLLVRTSLLRHIHIVLTRWILCGCVCACHCVRVCVCCCLPLRRNGTLTSRG